MTNSFIAWCKVSSISVLSALALVVIYPLILRDSTDLSGLLIIGGIAALVHLCALAVIGIPFFICFWPEPQNIVWRFPSGIAIGFILGYVSMLVIAIVSTINTQVVVNSEMLTACIVGGAYGGLTAFVACCYSRTRGQSLASPTNKKANKAEMATPRKPSDEF